MFGLSDAKIRNFPDIHAILGRKNMHVKSPRSIITMLRGSQNREYQADGEAKGLSFAAVLAILILVAVVHQLAVLHALGLAAHVEDHVLAEHALLTEGRLVILSRSLFSGRAARACRDALTGDTRDRRKCCLTCYYGGGCTPLKSFLLS